MVNNINAFLKEEIVDISPEEIEDIINSLEIVSESLVKEEMKLKTPQVMLEL